MNVTTTAYTVQTIEVRPGAYRVETRTGSIVGQLINELTASFATEQVANRVADEIRDNSGQCAAEIREAVRDMLQYEYANEINRPYINQAYLSDLERALDIFTPADEMDRLNEMATRMYDELATAPKTLNQIREERAEQAARNYQEAAVATDDTEYTEAEIDALLAFAKQVGDTVAAGVHDEDRAKTFADIKRMHAEAIGRDRGQVA